MTAKGDTAVSSLISTSSYPMEKLKREEKGEDDEENEELSRPSSRLSTEKPADSPDSKDNGPLTMKVPTATKKSRKRKNLLSNYDDTMLDQAASEAQRKEKERLERLEKIEQTVSNTDHIAQVAALQPLPIIDLTDNDFIFDDAQQSMDSYIKPEVIDLSSDDEDEIQEVGSFNRAAYFAERRLRYNMPEKEKPVLDAMERQQRLEEERMKKKEHLLKDIERQDFSAQGRLIVNKGHPPEDPDITVADHLTHRLQPHQLGGICFMYNNVIESLEEYKKSPGFGCILAHSMGLGKTLQIVTFTDVFFRATGAHKVLIIVPINTIQNWWNEYDKWMPKTDEAGNKIRNFNVYILGDAVKTFDQRVTLLETWTREGGVMIIGYDMFRLLLRSTQPKKKKTNRPKLNFLNGQRIQDPTEDPDNFDQGFTTGGRVKKEANEVIRQALLDPGPELVVCDEGHKIKNLNTDISMALGAIKTTRRIVLTGYPLQNNLMEYYCMVDFVRPKYLGEKKTFSIMFERPIKNGSCVDATSADWKLAAQRTHVLIEKLRGFVQRRTHHLLKTILPQSREYVLLLRKSPLQHALYKNFLIYAQSEIRGGSSVFNPLKAFAACSKIWNHPDVLHKTVEARKEKRRKELEAAQSSSSSNSMTASPFGSPTTSAIAQGLGLTRNHIWPGFGGNELEIGELDDEGSCSIQPVKPKKGKKAPANLFTALMEEEGIDMDIESGLKYDWAEIAMGYHEPGVLDHGYKIKIAMDIINETIANGEKILLFSQNLTALDLIEQYLQKEFRETGERKWTKNQTYFRLDGSTNGIEREKLIKRFNGEQTANLFLISTRAGSLGINLVSANRCIILDACWNPCHDAQAVCRVYRYGQQKETFIYRLIMDNSMEKAIFNRQVSKHGLQQRVVDDAKVNANVTQKELETLLLYDESADTMLKEHDTSDWEIEDTILKKVIENNKNMLSTEPFLHESLIIEREEGLSEQEKMEAKVMFERERMMETNARGAADVFQPMRPTNPIPSSPFWPALNGMPPRPSLQMANYSSFGNDVNGYQNPISQGQVASGMYGQQFMPNQITFPQSSQQFPYTPTTYANSSYNQMNNGYQNFNNGYGNNFGQQPVVSSYDQSGQNYQAPNYTFSDGTEAVPSFSFPGACRATPLTINSTGSMQKIVLDRPMVLPNMTNLNRPTRLDAGSECTVIRSGHKVFLKSLNGTVLDASNTIFDTANMYPFAPTTMGHTMPQQFAPLPQLVPTDLIELD